MVSARRAHETRQRQGRRRARHRSSARGAAGGHRRVHRDHSGVDAKRACELIREHRLPHECVPNELKSSPGDLGGARRAHGPDCAHAEPQQDDEPSVSSSRCRERRRWRVRSSPIEHALFKARVHPIQVLIALKAVRRGPVATRARSRGSGSEVIDALDAAFYSGVRSHRADRKAHAARRSTCSGSMNSMMTAAKISAREGSVAMAKVTARTERIWHAIGDHEHRVSLRSLVLQRSDGILRPGMTSRSVSLRVSVSTTFATRPIELPTGGTDCALSRCCTRSRTRSRSIASRSTRTTRRGRAIHPFQALRQYRERMGIPAKLVVVGMTSTGFTIADPTDAGCSTLSGSILLRRPSSRTSPRTARCSSKFTARRRCGWVNC